MNFALDSPLHVTAPLTITPLISPGSRGLQTLLLWGWSSGFCVCYGNFTIESHKIKSRSVSLLLCCGLFGIYLFGLPYPKNYFKKKKTLTKVREAEGNAATGKFLLAFLHLEFTASKALWFSFQEHGTICYNSFAVWTFWFSKEVVFFSMLNIQMIPRQKLSNENP